MEVLSAGLAGALAALRPGGRMAVISYHSGEDRIVKRFIAREIAGLRRGPAAAGLHSAATAAQLRPSHEGVITPTATEVRRNRRARSARLRVAEKLAVASA